MTNYRAILRLRSMDFSERAIAQLCGANARIKNGQWFCENPSMM